jgi:uncharacterized protein (DUF1786 family)
MALAHAPVQVVAAVHLTLRQAETVATEAFLLVAAAAAVTARLLEVTAVPALVVKSGSSATQPIPPEVLEHAAILW